MTAPAPLRIPLKGGFYALIDDADLEKAARHRWHLKQKASAPGRYYAQTTIRLTRGAAGKKTGLQLHRFLVDAPPGAIVDHVNGDGLDNRRENLRLTTCRGNSSNVVHSKNRKRGGYKGVSWNSNAGKWEAGIAAGEIRANGKRKRLYLGLFVDPADAARAYDEAALKYFGEFAAPNFAESAIRRGLEAALVGNEPVTLAALAEAADALGLTADGAP